jgi:hypothetical protein
LAIACLQKNLFFAGKEDVEFGQVSKLIGTWVLMLPHLRWSRVYLLLGIHYPLMWDGVFQKIRRWLLQILLWGLLRGRWRWRTFHIHGFFHPFEVNNLGEMVCIMSILTTESTGEVSLEIIVPPLSWLIVTVSPLGFLVILNLVAPRGMVLLGVISSWSWVVIVSVFPFHLGIIRRMGRIGHTQLFKSLKLLSGRGLNKVNIGMWLSWWGSNRLWTTREWKIWIVLWR